MPSNLLVDRSFLAVRQRSACPTVRAEYFK